MNLLARVVACAFFAERVAGANLRTQLFQEENPRTRAPPRQRRQGGPIPNVVLIVADQHRSDWTSFDIPGLHTTTFKTLANSGVRFTRATVPSPLCAPSRASLATGRRYGRTGLDWNYVDLPSDTLTFYKLLQENGIHTMTAGKDDLTMGSCPGADGSFHVKQLGFDSWVRCGGKIQVTGKCKLKEGYSHWLSAHHPFYLKAMGNAQPGKDPCDRLPVGHGKAVPGNYLCTYMDMPQGLYQDNFVAESAVRLISMAPENKPFFLQVNYPGPHEPTQVTKEMEELFGTRPNRSFLPLAVRSGSLPAETQHRIRRRYAMEVENIDHLNAKILAALEQKHVQNNTVVCITSDHGEQLGDFWDDSATGNVFGKTVPWQGSVSVPLACAGPGIAEGLVVDAPVSTLGLTATILELMGTSGDRLNMQSTSLMPYMTGEAWPDTPATSALARDTYKISTVSMALAGGTWKLMVCWDFCMYGFGSMAHKAQKGRNATWAVKLFDLQNDPHEQDDLLTSDVPTYVALALQLANHLQYPANQTEVKAVLLNSQKESYTKLLAKAWSRSVEGLPVTARDV